MSDAIAIPELRQLRYFVAVAEEMHFTRAAKRLNIAQPPLTQQIKQLEHLLGVALLVRTTRHVELTAAGQIFLAAARRTLAEAARAAEAARRAARGEVETLRIAFTDAGMFAVLPAALAAFRTRYPAVHLDLRESDSPVDLAEGVAAGSLDVALMRGPFIDARLHVEPLLEEPFYVALPASHPLASRARVPLRALWGAPMILFPRRASPAYHDRLVAICRAAGFAPTVGYEVERYTTILGLIASGIGVALVPRGNRNLSREGVVYRPLAGTTARAAVVAAWRGDGSLGTLGSFLAIARSVGLQSARLARTHTQGSRDEPDRRRPAASRAR